MAKPRPQFDSIFSTKTSLTKEKHKSLQKILDMLYLQPESFQFRQPLEYKKRGLINYDQIIQTPMDICTAQKQLKLKSFTSCEDYLDLVQTIFQNSFLYNRDTQWIIHLTKKCEHVFHKLVRNYLPEVKFKSDTGNKKIQKETKRLQKLENDKKVNSVQKLNLLLQVQSSQKEEQSQFTSISVIQPKKNSKNDLPSKLSASQEECSTLFALVKQASQKSLEVLYIMAKNEDIRTISADKNGNCLIDIENLSKKFILKAIAFLKSEAQRQKNVEKKEKKKKIKGKYEIGQSRYEV